MSAATTNLYLSIGFFALYSSSRSSRQSIRTSSHSRVHFINKNVTVRAVSRRKIKQRSAGYDNKHLAIRFDEIFNLHRGEPDTKPSAVILPPRPVFRRRTSTGSIDPAESSGKRRFRARASLYNIAVSFRRSTRPYSLIMPRDAILASRKAIVSRGLSAAGVLRWS